MTNEVRSSAGDCARLPTVAKEIGTSWSLLVTFGRAKVRRVFGRSIEQEAIITINSRVVQ